MATNRKTCFVIMPFGTTTPDHTEEYWTKHFRDFLKPLSEEISILQARRSEALRGDILRQIIIDLTSAAIVVADLTDRNANVYWELGVRQSFRHGTITIAESGTQIPFDMSTKGILWYHPNDYVRNDEFRRRYQNALRDCLAQPESPDSQVLETLSGQGTLFERFRREETSRRLEALVRELESNAMILDFCFKQAKENIGHPKARRIPTERVRTSALELLVTNRYIDEQTDFYSYAESVFGELIMMNAQMDRWNLPSMDSWILMQKEEKGLDSDISGFAATVKDLQKRLGAES
jgi:hypothetical protein